MSDKIIKNIIFDFGGVIINIDYWRSINAFIDMGYDNFDKIYSQASQAEIFDKIDKGTISADEFRSELMKFFPPDTTTKMIDDAWNAILLGIPEHRVRMLEKVRKNYRIILMSNTNILHYEQYIKELKEKFGYSDLSGLFEKVYLSFELGMRKPDKKFFNLILEENHLKPEETLFIDDSEQNLPPAQSLNLQTIFLNSGMDVTDLFENELLKSSLLRLHK
ncbi:MAG TPA: HAD family phosphatase [Bacteroidales bacterium]|nr:HAD family phosphatase [Bacteroidales bacterium]